MKWSRDTNDSMIFIFGDHGWSFNRDYMIKIKLIVMKIDLKPFFLIKLLQDAMV